MSAEYWVKSRVSSWTISLTEDQLDYVEAAYTLNAMRGAVQALKALGLSPQYGECIVRHSGTAGRGRPARQYSLSSDF